MPVPDPVSPQSYTCLALVLICATLLSADVAHGQAPDCAESQACRELALEARARGAHEAFHDLAWRAVQTGRANDPDLMYLLARAQALSGRRRDAIVTLRRLAEAGFANDAASDEDFRRVRELPDWAYIASLASRARPNTPTAGLPPTPAVVAPLPQPAVQPPAAPATPAASAPSAARSARPPVLPASPAPPAPAVSPAAPPAAAPAPAASALRVEPASVEDAARFSTSAFTPAGLAYDAVSRRFLFGDLSGRRLFVVGENSTRAVDLVRADSAGFEDVTAIAIDSKRGELWVASNATSGQNASVHRLQLISGRPLATLTAPGTEPVRLSDLAVTGDGTVLVLDSAAPRLLVRRAGATVLDTLMPLATPSPTSVAVDDNGRFAYVAHRDGITRVDVQARRAAAMKAANGIALAGFESLRWHRDRLVGTQLQPDGSRALVRLQLNGNRETVAAATHIDTPPSGDGSRTLAASGEDLFYVVVQRDDQASTAGSVSVAVRRIRTR
jgi:hypothetical protein